MIKYIFSYDVRNYFAGIIFVVFQNPNKKDNIRVIPCQCDMLPAYGTLYHTSSRLNSTKFSFTDFIGNTCIFNFENDDTNCTVPFKSRVSFQVINVLAFPQRKFIKNNNIKM